MNNDNTIGRICTALLFCGFVWLVATLRHDTDLRRLIVSHEPVSTDVPDGHPTPQPQTVQEQRIEPHVAPPQAEASSSPQAAPPVPSAPPSPKITIHPDTAVNPDTAALAQRLLSSSIPPTPGDELDDKLVETSKNLANRLPLMISDTHRIDGTIVQHHKMIFRVTVTDIDAKSASGFFPSDARPVFQQLLCPTLSEGETVEIQFSGSDGTSLRNITIDQTSCGEASDKGQMNLRDVLDNL